MSPLVSRRTALSLASGLSVLAVSGGPLRAQQKSRLNVALSSSLNNLDPARMTIGPEYTYSNLVFNGLSYIDREMKVRPDLAESWRSNDELTIWDFALRKGVKFHNGKEMTAADVVWTFERILDPKTASRMRGNLSIVSKIEAPEPYVVRITLKTGYADLPAVLADYHGRILPAGYEDQSKSPIGTGPFKFVEFVPGDRLLVAKNPDYWEPGLPKVDEVMLRIIPESASSTASLEAGDIHIVADIRAEQVRRLQSSRNAKVDTVPSGFWVSLVMRNSVPPFDDIRVRRALTMLIDKPEMTLISALGQGTPTQTPIPPSHPFYIRDMPIPKPDPEGARALLKEAGHGNGLNLTLWFPNSDTEAERMGVAFRDQAKKAGVNVELMGVPADKFYGEIEGKQPFTTTNFFGRPTPDTMLYAWFHSAGSWNQNLWNYKSSELDRLLEEGRQLKSEDARKDVYQKVQKLLLADMPSPVIYVKNHSNAYRNNVSGFKSTPRIWLELKEVAVAK